METNEIMTNETFENEEVIYDFDDCEVEESSGKGLKTVVGIGLIAGLGYLGYRFVVKPIKAKLKAKKEAETTKYGVVETQQCPVCDED